MDRDGLWNLFFATGLPEVYLALRGAENEKNAPWAEPAMTAFLPEGEHREQS